MPPPKKPSGAEFRKIREARKDKQKTLADKMNKWISTSNNTTVNGSQPGMARASSSIIEKVTQDIDECSIFESMIIKDTDQHDGVNTSAVKEDDEKERWRYILKVILDIVLFCAKNNLALRGSIEEIGHRKSGIFLSVLELMSKHNPQIAAHISSITKKSISYFSSTIQNELITFLGSAVRNEIISRILKAKYYSISFDCTPDINHREQMSQIVRYVLINDGKCTVEESFIDFIETSEKTGNGLAEEILNKLSKDNLRLSDCRGQAYDNGANMADTLIQQMEWRFQSLSSVAFDFGFLTGLSLQETPIEELKKSAADLALKYKEDLDVNELCLEIESFKHQANSLLPDLKMQIS
ncbi:zinc finger mym-type protein 1-like protein [Lasius niger]|uniref:Zinc finger mym-type protein 1-like protein n=1 Tax=Lasius niger TaxID=67767 RepID=A0A0J7KE35_LASNI|nr:zinc finger mym-type protein 1-like protein [Lasius niger]